MTDDTLGILSVRHIRYVYRLYTADTTYTVHIPNVKKHITRKYFTQQVLHTKYMPCIQGVYMYTSIPDLSSAIYVTMCAQSIVSMIHWVY